MPIQSNGDGNGLSAWLREHVPFGLMQPNKPRHFRAIVKTLRDNAGQLGDAWRVLNGP